MMLQLQHILEAGEKNIFGFYMEDDFLVTMVTKAEKTSKKTKHMRLQAQMKF